MNRNMGAIDAFTFKLRNFISNFSLISWKKYFGPRYFDNALQTEIMQKQCMTVIHTVHTAIPKVLAVMPKNPAFYLLIKL